MRKGIRGRRGGNHGRINKTARMNRKAARVIAWNARSHKARRTTIEKLVQENNIVMIQETKLKQKPTYGENHVFFSPTEELGNAKRGLLTIIEETFECCEVQTPKGNQGVETLAVNVQLEGQSSIFVNIYVPGETLKKPEEWTQILNPLLRLGQRVIISGDFNARSPMWKDTSHNGNGRALEEALPQISGVIVNNDGPTRIAERAGDSDSCIDLTIVSLPVLLDVRWKLLPLMGSDHRPALVHISTHHTGREQVRYERFRYKTRGSSITAKLRNEVRQERSKRVKRDVKKPSWMTGEVEKAWQEKLTASSAFIAAKKDRESRAVIEERKRKFNELADTYTQVAEKARQSEWDKFCLECDPNDPAVINKFWKLAKTLRNTASGGRAGPQQIKGPQGEFLRTDKEKGEAFLSRYKGQLQPNGETTVKAAWQEVDARVRAQEREVQDKPVSVGELDAVLRATRKDSAPGPDGVRYPRVKALSREEKKILARDINQSMMSGKVEEHERDCRMAVLPKPFKDHFLLKGYRIITMANIWIKVKEKIAARRLVRELEEKNLLPPEVGGARPCRTTTSNVETTIHHIQQSLQERKHCAIGIFDLEDAYNKVDVGILAQKLHRLGVSDTLIRWILALLDTRRCQMQFGKWKSSIFPVSSGLPQGSPLSSVLFNVYTADLVANLSRTRAKPYTFVDDIIVSSIGDTPVQAVERLQDASNSLCEWTEANKMSIQPDKACWMLTTLAHIDSSLFTINYNGGVVPKANSVTCLGIVMDRRMKMTEHIHHVKVKASKSLPLLRYAAAQNVQQRSLANLMTATVCSRVDYGIHLVPGMAKTALRSLQSVLNEAMRIVSGAAKPTSCDALRFWLGVLQVEERQRLAAAAAFLKAITTHSHPLGQHLREGKDQEINQRLKTIRSWVIDARDMVESVCPVENINHNPWSAHDNITWELVRIGNRSWRERSEVINKTEILEWLDEKRPNIVIATDGSIHDDVTAWGGAVWKEGRECFSWCTARHGRSSSFRSEAEAFEDALVWISQNTSPHDKVAILTDSLSLVSKVESGMIRKSWLKHMNRIRAFIILAYIPGHCGIPFNERADQLAGDAQPVGNLQREPSDIMAVLKSQTTQMEITRQSQYWSTQRLKDRNRKYGEGAKLKVRGRQRYLHNQLELGVLTKASLRKVIEGGGPELIAGAITPLASTR